MTGGHAFHCCLFSCLEYGTQAPQQGGKKKKLPHNFLYRHFYLSSSTRRGIYTRRPPGQAVVTSAHPSPSRYMPFRTWFSYTSGLAYHILHYLVWYLALFELGEARDPRYPTKNLREKKHKHTHTFFLSLYAFHERTQLTTAADIYLPARFLSESYKSSLREQGSFIQHSHCSSIPHTLCRGGLIGKSLTRNSA